MIIDKATNIADNIHGIITISEFEKKIISTTIFNRLHNIHQNSTAYLTFPANRTKRFEHSLGTMFLCSKIFFYSFSNAEEDTLDSFFSSADEQIEGIIEKIKDDTDYKNKLGGKYKKIDQLKDNITFQGGIYNCFIPSNVKAKYRWLYCIFFESVRISALLHDIGHPPFSHITEYAINAVYNTIKNSEGDNLRIKRFIDIIEPYVNEDNQLHEQVGILVTKKLILSAIKDYPGSSHLSDAEYIKQLFEILVRALVIGILTEENNFFKDLHGIIDGTLDGDRLDYITRDPLNSGLEVGRIEYERLINGMRLYHKDTRYMFCPSTKVLNTLDNFIQRRFEIYKNILYHHRVVKTDYLLQETIKELSLEYLEKTTDNDAYNEDAENANILPYDISGIWEAIKNQPSEFEFSNSIIQWDDSWLITVLKKHYFEDFYDNESILSAKLRELLTNEKSYYSVIKTKEDFGIIDLEVARVLEKEFEEICRKQEELKTKSNNYSEKDGMMNVDEYFKQLGIIKEKIGKYFRNKSVVEIDGYILPWINSTICVKEINPLDEVISKAIDRIKQTWQDSFKDIIIIHKNLTTGIGKPLFLHRSNAESNDDLVMYKSISNISQSLKYDINFCQSFYIYVLNYEGRFNNTINYNEFRKDIGEIIGEEISNDIKSRLSTFDIVG